MSLANAKTELAASSTSKRRSHSTRSYKPVVRITGRGGEKAPALRRVADFGECASLKIPVPISVNAMYRNLPGRGRVKTTALKNWKLEAEWEVARQNPPRFVGQVDISITLRYPPNGRADCSNYIKCVEDLLVTCGVIEDDSCKHVRSVAARWSREETSCRVNVYHAPAEAA
jgi:Holliday junction resolvase RusA-like endonuclease